MNKYQVIYDGNRKFIRLEKEYYEAGEIVTFHYPHMKDESLKVSCEPLVVRTSQMEDHQFTYQFTMPECDVTLEITSVSDMAFNPNQTVAMAMMGQYQTLKIPQPQQSTQETTFCKNCGQVISKDAKFCKYCGFAQ